jgi:predicted RNase H-like HicB family nuclease
MTNHLEVHAFWDDEASVWVAESDDVPGLVTEAETMDHLMERLQIIIPELMELNCNQRGPFTFHVVSKRTAIAQAV